MGVDRIESEADLRELIPEPSPKVRLKILDSLERHSQHMIALSSLVAISCEAEGASASLSLLSTRGDVTTQNAKTLRINDPDRTLRDAWQLPTGEGKGRGVGGLFMVGGIEETLRVNGRAKASADDASVLVEVDEVYLQCPKAFVRSRLWDPATWQDASGSPIADHDPAPVAALTPGMLKFIARSPFGFVATESADGRGDISPRGDPLGLFVRLLDDGTILLPDRTGNHLVDTLRNVLSRPRASVVLLLPGATDALRIQGAARITADEALLAPSAVKGKPPKVGIILEVERAQALHGALDHFWNAEALVDPKDFPTMGEMILDQVNPKGKLLNKIGAKVFDLGNTFHKRRRLY